ncbi:MAG: 3-deoxy-manno-octulosonate cytidylyltransferase [Planctomycetota bacterium]|nr:MAG: 3-deoxy-manno-octulosonate cytidylyltransferase [Planctomycetota bacterium]
MRVVAVIPARYASTRLPGKPLLRETGKYLIQHVWERVTAAKSPGRVIIATDNEDILQAAHSFGAEAVMTPEDCPSGTDRIHAAITDNGIKADIILNIQGDEPEIDPANVDILAGLLEDPESEMATLAVGKRLEDGFADPSVVKVVTDGYGNALYFSRASIPHDRNGKENVFLAHVGVYGFRRDALENFVRLPKGGLEEVEKLEQLRALEAGMKIRVGLVESAAPGIDTPEDYAAFVKRYGRKDEV